MIFAEEFGPVSITAVVLGVIGTIGGGMGWLLTFLRKNKKEDEETTLGHFKTLLDREKKECNEALEMMERKVLTLETKIAAIEAKAEVKIDAQMKALEACNRELASALARNRYLVAKCRDAGLKIDPWELPPDSATHTAIGG